MRVFNFAALLGYALLFCLFLLGFGQHIDFYWYNLPITKWDGACFLAITLFTYIVGKVIEK